MQLTTRKEEGGGGEGGGGQGGQISNKKVRANQKRRYSNGYE